MKKLAWITDIHWDRVEIADRNEQVESIMDADPDAVILSGDIGESHSFSDFLTTLHDSLSCPIYFVLGNHDFWHGSIADVRNVANELSGRLPNLNYLSSVDFIPVGSSTCLLGYEGWGDGRSGDPDGASEFPRDFLHITDLQGLSRDERFEKIKLLGDEAATALYEKFMKALPTFENVFAVIHVPPFPEACLDSFRICHEHKLPFYCCEAVGKMLVSLAEQFPKNKITLFCGHTHHKVDLNVLANLRIRVKESAYGGCFPPTIVEVPA